MVLSFAAALYIYGDNINYIMQRYGEELGCGEQCVTNNRIAAVISLGTALIILELFPPAIHKFIKIVEWEDTRSTWYSSLDMITIILRVDVLYTAVAIFAQTDEFCGHTDKALSASFITLCIIVGLSIMVINCVYSMKKVKNDDNAVFYMVGTCVPLAFSLIMFMLADNEQPIDCAFICDSFAANQTLNDLSCNIQGTSGLRLGFMLVTFTIIVVVGFVLFCKGILSEDNDDENDGPNKRAEDIDFVVSRPV